MGMPTDPDDANGPRLAVKDLIDVAGVPTTSGSKYLAAAAVPAATDAACLTGARAADARIVGKTNLVELAFGADGVNPWFGTPENPLDQSLIPGGSSSGSAVAVANDDAEVALGTDTGGSVRIPAACCGVAGLKTTNGRVSLDGVRPVSPTLDTVGPMASTVDGLVLGMQLLEPGFTVDGWGPDRVARVRLPAPDWIDDAIDDALGGTGWKVVDIDPSGWLAAWRPAMCMLDWEAMQSFAPLLPHLDQLDPAIADRITRSSPTTREQYEHALAQRDEWRAEIAALFTEFDLLVLPTLAEPVPNLDDFRNARLTACTVQANSAGVPAVALPVGAHSPVPASAQLVAPWDAEERLLAAALVLEAAAE
jgi:amidase